MHYVQFQFILNMNMQHLYSTIMLLTLCFWGKDIVLVSVRVDDY